VETALVASGFASERYQFVGFLPRGANALRALWEELARWPYAVVAFESPRRLPATLRSLADADGEWQVAVCRELTKRFEDVVRGGARDVAARFAAAPKGEITLVLGPRAPADDTEKAVAAVTELVTAGVPRRRAADIVAGLTGVSRNELYRRTL
jgi:16S rRNA (cytidine1402-2'-O)-methyltransferase